MSIFEQRSDFVVALHHLCVSLDLFHSSHPLTNRWIFIQTSRQKRCDLIQFIHALNIGNGNGVTSGKKGTADQPIALQHAQHLVEALEQTSLFLLICFFPLGDAVHYDSGEIACTSVAKLGVPSKVRIDSELSICIHRIELFAAEFLTKPNQNGAALNHWTVLKGYRRYFTKRMNRLVLGRPCLPFIQSEYQRIVRHREQPTSPEHSSRGLRPEVEVDLNSRHARLVYGRGEEKFLDFCAAHSLID